jgi:hypothetical protein
MARCATPDHENGRLGLAKAKRGLKATLHGSTDLGAGLRPVARNTEIFKRGYVTSEFRPDEAESAHELSFEVT